MIDRKELEKKAEEWLKSNDWDYQKYGDRRDDRSAYDTLMKYEISGRLADAFMAGAELLMPEVEKLRAELAKYESVPRLWVGEGGE